MKQDIFSCVFRVDAGGDRGIGHFRRCLVLGQALQKLGHSAVFVMSSVPENLKRTALAKQIRIIEYDRKVTPGTPEDAILFAESVKPGEFDWIIFDGYHFDKSYRESVAAFGRRCLIIQDGPGDYSDADIVLDQNVAVDFGRYAIGGGILLHGPEYALVEGDYNLRNKRFPRRNKKNRLLVTLGGADVKKLTLPVVAAVTDRDVEADVVLGAVSSWKPADFENYKERVRLHIAPDGLDSLMAEADIGVMSLGITTWEMCFYGLPFIMLESNINQRLIIKWFEDAGIAINGLGGGDFDSEYFLECLDRYIQNPSFCRSCSEKLLSIVDGQGACRVITEMMDRN